MGPSSLPQKGTEPPPQFSARFYCGQTAGCVKMPLGTDVGLSPGDFVLDGDPVHLPKSGRSPQNFRPMFIVSKRLDGSRCHLVRRYRRGSRDSVLDGHPAPLPTKGVEPPPQFSAPFYFYFPGDFVLDGDPAPLPFSKRRPGQRFITLQPQKSRGQQ